MRIGIEREREREKAATRIAVDPSPSVNGKAAESGNRDKCTVSKASNMHTDTLYLPLSCSLYICISEYFYLSIYVSIFNLSKVIVRIAEPMHGAAVESNAAGATP